MIIHLKINNSLFFKNKIYIILNTKKKLKKQNKYKYKNNSLNIYIIYFISTTFMYKLFYYTKRF